MSRREAILRKLVILTGYLDELKVLARLSAEEYDAQPVSRRAAERLLALIVEAASDVNALALASLGRRPPDEYYESFVEVGANGVIDEALALQLAPSAGLRNRLVHEYEAINNQIVYGSIHLALRLYSEFVRQMRDFAAGLAD